MTTYVVAITSEWLGTLVFIIDATSAAAAFEGARDLMAQAEDEAYDMAAEAHGYTADACYN